MGLLPVVDKETSLTEVKKKAGRGRPSTGNAKTPTERVKALDAALLASGGRVVNRVRLSKEAVDALAVLAELDGSERAAFENSLIERARRIK